MPRTLTLLPLGEKVGRGADRMRGTADARATVG